MLSVKRVDPAQEPVLAELEKHPNSPTNLFGVLAHQPHALRHFAQLYDAVMGPGSVRQRIKELAYLTASYVNECEYCTAHHIASGSKAGISKDEMVDIQTEQNQNFSAEERAAILFARELTRTVDVETEIQNAMQQHFSSQQIVELALVVSLANFTNRISNAFSLKPEEKVLAAG